jgi:hypothetical protein
MSLNVTCAYGKPDKLVRSSAVNIEIYKKSNEHNKLLDRFVKESKIEKVKKINKKI